jgi:hypothetical protein
MLAKLWDALHVKNWRIGIAKTEISDLIRSRKVPEKLHWLFRNELHSFQADPFVYKNDNEIHVLFEELNRNDFKGRISSVCLDGDLKIKSVDQLVERSWHLSYPFLITAEGRQFMIPEAATSGKVSAYHLIDHKWTEAAVLLQEPLLDSTIIFSENKYWLFGSKISGDGDDELQIYFSENFTGPYQPHSKNPLKTGRSGVRPAGSIIEIDGELYRPAQDSSKVYGGALIIWKISTLSPDRFEEEEWMRIDASQLAGGFSRVHTINHCNGIIVLDAAEKIFAPSIQLKRLIRGLFKK